MTAIFVAGGKLIPARGYVTLGASCWIQQPLRTIISGERERPAGQSSLAPARTNRTVAGSAAW